MVELARSRLIPQMRQDKWLQSPVCPVKSVIRVTSGRATTLCTRCVLHTGTHARARDRVPARMHPDDFWVVDRNYHKSWNMTSWWRARGRQMERRARHRRPFVLLPAGWSFPLHLPCSRRLSGLRREITFGSLDKEIYRIFRNHRHRYRYRR